MRSDAGQLQRIQQLHAARLAVIFIPLEAGCPGVRQVAGRSIGDMQNERILHAAQKAAAAYGFIVRMSRDYEDLAARQCFRNRHNRPLATHSV
jgi:hypothetical protein